MRQIVERLLQSKFVIAGAAIVALILFCVGATITFGQDGPPMSEAPKTQPDTRPSGLQVQVGGKGVSSTQAAAALQSQSAQSAALAAPPSGASVMGQSSVQLQAGVGGMNVDAKTELPVPGLQPNLPLP